MINGDIRLLILTGQHLRRLNHYYNNFRTVILPFRVSHERIVHSIFIYEIKLPLIGCGYDRPISFFPSPFASSSDLSRLFPLYIAYTSNHLSTCSPHSFLLSSSSDLSPRLFFSRSLFPSMESSTLQSGATTYTIRWIPSPGSLVHRGERNRTKPSTHGAQTTTGNTAGAVSIFCHPGIRERERSSGRFHRGGRYQIGRAHV